MKRDTAVTLAVLGMLCAIGAALFIADDWDRRTAAAREGGPASAPENGAPQTDWVAIDHGIGTLHTTSGTLVLRAMPYARVLERKVQDQVDQAELAALFAGYDKITYPGGEVVWEERITWAKGAAGWQPTPVVFFGYPVDRVEVDPETGRLMIYAEVAPVESAGAGR